MEVLVDGQARAFDNMPVTIGGLLEEIRSSAVSQNRVILSITLDGAEMVAREQADAAGTPSANHSMLEVITADARELCAATIEEAARHISPVVDESLRIAALIDAGKESEALTRIATCMEVWGTIMAAVEKVCMLLELKLEDVSHRDTTLADDIAGLAGFLQTLQTAIDARDLVGVRDAMKHEMGEVADRLENQLSALCTAVSAS